MDNGTCPTCGKLLDGLTNPTGGSLDAQPGDISVCAYCGEVLIFDESLKLKLSTEEDLKDLDQEVKQTLKRVKEVILSRLN